MVTDLILGTAGHIDHGKTSLIRALTGVDTDRLPEEKKRGITIDLGFAELCVGEYRLGIVDVPGHERFVRNMLAGATGMDLALLVVAADDSIKPQTLEHFDILRLLDLRAGVIAVTKCDLVDAAWIELVEDEIREFVRGSFLESAPLVRTSTATGQGLDTPACGIGGSSRAGRATPLPRCGHRTVPDGHRSGIHHRRPRHRGDGECQQWRNPGRRRTVDRAGRSARAGPRTAEPRPADAAGASRPAGGHQPGRCPSRGDRTRTGTGHSRTSASQPPVDRAGARRRVAGAADQEPQPRARPRGHRRIARHARAARHRHAGSRPDGLRAAASRRPRRDDLESAVRDSQRVACADVGGGQVLVPDAERLRRDAPETLARLAHLAVRPAAGAGRRGALLRRTARLAARRPGAHGRASTRPRTCPTRCAPRACSAKWPCRPPARSASTATCWTNSASASKPGWRNSTSSIRCELSIDRQQIRRGFVYVDDAVFNLVLSNLRGAGRIRLTDQGVALEGHGPKLSQNERKLLAQLVEDYRQAGLESPTVQQMQQRATKNQASVPSARRAGRRQRRSGRGQRRLFPACRRRSSDPPAAGRVTFWRDRLDGEPDPRNPEYVPQVCGSLLRVPGSHRLHASRRRRAVAGRSRSWHSRFLTSASAAAGLDHLGHPQPRRHAPVRRGRVTPWPNVLRNIPSVNELLDSPPLRKLMDRASRSVVLSGVRDFLDNLRHEVQSAAAEIKLPAAGGTGRADRPVDRPRGAARAASRDQRDRHPVAHRTGARSAGRRGHHGHGGSRPRLRQRGNGPGHRRTFPTHRGRGTPAATTDRRRGRCRGQQQRRRPR